MWIRLLVKLLRTLVLVSCLLPLITAFSFGVTFVLQICCDVTLSHDHVSLWSPLTDVLSSLFLSWETKTFCRLASSYHHYWCLSFTHHISSDLNWTFPDCRVSRVHHTRLMTEGRMECLNIYRRTCVRSAILCGILFIYYYYYTPLFTVCHFVWLLWRKKLNDPPPPPYFQSEIK